MPRRSKRQGRPPVLLDHDTRTQFLRYVEDGNHIKTACALVGIHPATIYRWIERAEDADELLLDNQPIDEVQRVYCDFRDAYVLARARAQKVAVDTIQRAMKGGQIISEKPLQNMDGEAVRDDEGRILYERTFTQPDGRLALAYLGRTAPDMWGQNAQKLELTGANGGPIAIEQQVAGLADRIAQVAAARMADRELEAAEADDDEGDIRDADVVDEG
jgi:hypothetical protein